MVWSPFFASFLESQSKLLGAQTNALAIQSVPPLICFSGEGMDDEDNSLSSWLDRLEERASLLGWSVEQKNNQL